MTSTFSEANGQTTITIEIEYLTQEARDAAMQPGFAEGYEASFQHLDEMLPDLAGGS